MIAKGSAGERRTQIYIGMESGYIGKEKGERWFKEVLRISGMLSSLIIKLKERKLSA
ncbi:MAG: four helix bundle protein [Pseudohongiellaceae bacterium]